MRSPDPRLYLEHILESIELAREYVTGVGSVEFLSDRKLQDAVVRRIEIIGEAVKRLPGELTSSHPDIPWRKIAGMRDKIVHDYMGIDQELVWNVVRVELPPLAEAVARILRDRDGARSD